MPQVNYNDIPRNGNQQQNNNQQNAPRAGGPPRPELALSWLLLLFFAIPFIQFVYGIASFLVEHAKWATNILAIIMFFVIVSQMCRRRG